MGVSSDKNKKKKDNKLEEILCSKCGDIPEIIAVHIIVLIVRSFVVNLVKIISILLIIVFK
jgi:hypothetical protein